ncbi:PIG-L deacetylase family protein [Arthrobacter ulcerisalmonis]|uniref:PIG-L deacetylase family protein n=1 Tax=Arthrobacter ulcerisalmonis TaxID=2483813 RepID=UPI003670CB42
MSFTLAEPGTLESDWAEALAGGSVAPLVLDWSRFDRLVVLAAHPDDESLAAGGLISQAHAHHVDIVLIVATRGQNSHPQSPTMTPDQLGDLRIHELRRALACLAHDAVLLEGGFVDGRLADSRSQLAAELNGLCSQDPARVLLVAPWSGDGHTDHEVAGDVALQVAASTGCAVLEYPIWLWFWGTPSSGDVPWAALRSLELGETERGRKALAMAEHRSQVEPSPLPRATKPSCRAMCLTTFVGRLKCSSTALVVSCPRNDKEPLGWGTVST